jgi:hypothetical protein
MSTKKKTEVKSPFTQKMDRLKTIKSHLKVDLTEGWAFDSMVCMSLAQFVTDEQWDSAILTAQTHKLKEAKLEEARNKRVLKNA